MMASIKPRERILNVADELFYQRGIHAVGVDEIVTRSGAAKTTLYGHFHSKDQLVVSYLQRRSDRWRSFLEAELAKDPGSAAERIDLIFTLLAAGCADPTFRGCPFINAAAEFPDPSHPARKVVDAHRTWIRGIFRELADEAGAEDPEALAVWLGMLYDSAMVTTHLDPQGALAAKQARAAARVLVTASDPDAPAARAA
jgi:AcrR family transcriptional regulator